MLQFRRQVTARLLKHRSSPNFWIGRNGAATLAGAENSALDKGYVISYLQNSCGFSLEKAISASRRVHFDCPDKPNAVVDFLVKQGFTRSQIAKIVERYPYILTYNPDKILLPKLEYLLHSTGIPESEIREFVCKSPDLLTRSFERRVIPVYNYVKGIIGGGKTNVLLMKGSWIFCLDLEGRLQPNVDCLREVGVSERFITFALLHCESIFRSDHVEFKRIVDEVKQMGFDPMKSTFILAIKARLKKAYVALWDQSFDVYRKWGWTGECIRMAYITHPNCMILSEKKISTTLDYLVNTLGLESKTIARCPQALFYSLEGRIVPRCSVVHLLSLEGLITKDWCLTSVLYPTEEKFLDKFVKRYVDKMPQLYDIYQSRKC